MRLDGPTLQRRAAARRPSAVDRRQVPLGVVVFTGRRARHLAEVL